MTNKKKKIEEGVYGPVIGRVNASAPISYKPIGQTAGGAGIYSAAMPKAESDLKISLASEETPTANGVYGAAVGSTTPTPTSSVPTYTEWLANGKVSATDNAYTNYINQQKQIEENLAAQKRAAQTAYDTARAVYGAQGEAMRAKGLSGAGYSDYLDSKAYAQSQGRVATAEQSALDAKRAAEENLYAKYEERANTVKSLKDNVYTATADELYALKNRVGSDITQAEYDELITEWKDYNAKKGNTSAIESYGKLTGEDTKGAVTEINISTARNNLGNANVADPTRLLSGITNLNDKRAFAPELAKHYLDKGEAKVLASSGNTVSSIGTDIDDINENIRIQIPGMKKKTAEIKATYQTNSDIGILLDSLSGGKDGSVVVLGGNVYVKATKKGQTRWILTDAYEEKLTGVKKTTSEVANEQANTAGYDTNWQRYR